MSLRHIFFVTGGVQLLATVLVLIFVREDYKPDPKTASLDRRSFFQMLRTTGIVLPLFVVSMVLQMGYLAIEPIVTIYVRELSPTAPHLTTLAGAVFAAVGFGNLLSAPRLGRLSDRVGSEKILFWSLVAAALLYLPQAFASSAYVLMGMRFVLGLAIGGLVPSVQALIRRYTPEALQGRAFGYNSSFLMAGNLVGPLLGGFLSGAFGIRMIFFVTASLFAVNAVWVAFAVVSRVQRGAAGAG
jgi:MFS family permease